LADGLSAGGILGIVFGILVLLVIVAVGVMLWFKGESVMPDFL
jgi:hypothetical protein